MIIAAILLGICQIITTLGACLLLRHFFNAKQAEIEARAEQALRDWLAPTEPGKPSKAGEVLATMGAIVGQNAAQSIMNSLNADKSHTARMANTASELIGAQQNPLLGLLAGGKRGKGAALARLSELLLPMLNQGAAAKPQQESELPSVAERIGRNGG